MWSVLFTAGSSADSLKGKDIEVQVNMAGENIVIDLNFAVPATRQEVWNVLIDFDRMSDFVSNLKESKVISVSEDKLTIFQRGAGTYGPLTYPFESTREVRLVPYYKIRTHLISGSMRKLEGMTHLIDEVFGQTRVIHRTDVIPKAWIPAAVRKYHRARNAGAVQGDAYKIIKRKRASLKERQT